MLVVIQRYLAHSGSAYCQVRGFKHVRSGNDLLAVVMLARIISHDSTVLADHFARLVDLLHNVVNAAKDCMRFLKQTMDMAPVSMCLTTLQSEWKRKEIQQCLPQILSSGAARAKSAVIWHIACFAKPTTRLAIITLNGTPS